MSRGKSCLLYTSLSRNGPGLRTIGENWADHCFIQKQLDAPGNCSALEEGSEAKEAPISCDDSSLYLFSCFPIEVNLAS